MTPTLSSAWAVAFGLMLAMNGCEGDVRRHQALMESDIAQLNAERAEAELVEANARAEIAAAELAEAKARAELREITGASP